MAGITGKRSVLPLVAAALLSSVAAPRLSAQGLSAQGCGALPRLDRVGSGTPGSTGVPELHAVGQPMVNQPGMGLRIVGGAPGAQAQFVVGARGAPQPLSDYGALLYPNPPFTRFPAMLGSNGNSPTLLSGPAPTSPALCGLEFVAQGLVADAAAQGGFAFTGGLALRFGVGSAAGSLYLGMVFPVVSPPNSTINAGCFAPGDFNSDGLADLAVAVILNPSLGPGVSGAQVMLQLDDGSFWRSSFLSTAPGYPKAIAAADFDGDGALDLAIGSLPYPPPAKLGTLEIWRGNGAGSFRLVQTLSDPNTSPYAMAVGDFTGDGRPDLAVATWTADAAIGVFTNSGAATFGSAVLLQPVGGVTADGLRAADIDGDGQLDLLSLVATSWLAVQSGLGGGAFGPPVYTPLGTQLCVGLAAGDLDADGDVDLAVSAFGGLIDGSLRVLWNTGGGQLSAPAVLGWRSIFKRPSIADLDEDGLPEVVSDDGLRIVVAHNLGGGTFEPLEDTPLSTADCIPADMDGDGHVDLATISNDAVRVTRGAGDGSFVLAPPVAGFQAVHAVATDVDLDGHVDLVGAGSSAPGDVLQVVLGTGHGGFGAPIASLGSLTQLKGLDVGLIDGDALPDVVARHGNTLTDTITVALGQGNGIFAVTNSTPLPGIHGVRLADLDADGALDVLASAQISNPATLYSLRGAGDGSFSAPQAAGPALGGFDLGDVDEDGLLDVVSLGSSTLWLQMGKGDGTFGAPVILAQGEFQTSGPDDQRLRLADFDHDGHLDLVHSAGFTTNAEHLLVYRGNGAGAFVVAQSLPGGLGTRLTVADVNDDGAPDVVGAGVMLGFGDATFAGVQPGSFVGPLADFDEDGDLDVLGLASTCRVYLNRLY